VGPSAPDKSLSSALHCRETINATLDSSLSDSYDEMSPFFPLPSNTASQIVPCVPSNELFPLVSDLYLQSIGQGEYLHCQVSRFELSGYGTFLYFFFSIVARQALQRNPLLSEKIFPRSWCLRPCLPGIAPRSEMLYIRYPLTMHIPLHPPIHDPLQRPEHPPSSSPNFSGLAS
jgi:hypothetical protein